MYISSRAVGGTALRTAILLPKYCYLKMFSDIRPTPLHQREPLIFCQLSAGVDNLLLARPEAYAVYITV